jgi:imidazole glycerol phosphate synthase glutamine amidotransferase subunit
MITILDYGAGNLRSVQNTLSELGAPHVLTHEAAGVARAGRIILPGVGHFGQMMRALDRMQVREALIERIRGGVPFLGICLGLHALFEASDEAPDLPGFGMFPGRIRRFASDVRVPHTGWNEIDGQEGAKLLEGLGRQPYLYFNHSYYAPVVKATAATCDYSLPYTAVLEHENIHGVQFHPEKSGPLGLQLMRNFIKQC